MNIRGTSQNSTITNDLIKLTISGIGNNVIIKSHVKNLKISGTSNLINGLDPNCLIDNLNIAGISNNINLNQNCINVNKHISGFENEVKFDGVSSNNSNNMNNMNNRNNNVHQNMRVIRIENNQVINDVFNDFFNDNRNRNNLQNLMNQFNNFRINNNQNPNNSNSNINNINQSSRLNNNNNLSDFDKKKQELFLEMDEFQFKHIQKYDSRKETECAICLEEFKGIDMIKAFTKCEHIFHKKCLKSWLQRSNVCPLCKHDLTEDINQGH